MYKTMILAAVLAMAFAACGGGSGPASSPEDTYENIKAAVKGNDWAAMVDFIPPSKLASAEADFKKGLEDPMGLTMMAGMMGVKPEELKEMDFRTAMGKMFESMSKKDPAEMDKMLNSTIKESKIDGDKATLTVTDGDETEEIKLVQEDGLWYMADFGS